MSQDYQKAILDHFYDLSSDAPAHHGLADVLADQSQHRLVGIRRALGIELSGNAMDQMKHKLTDPLFLEELLLFLPEDSMQALDRLRRRNLANEDILSLPGIHELIVFGLVYIYRPVLAFIMPDEIRNALPQQVNTDRRYQWQQVIQVMRGAINLYGAIEEDELMQQVRRLPAIDQLPLQAILSLLLRSTRIIWQHSPWLTSTAWCRNEKDLFDLLAVQQSCPYREVPIAELILYANDGYVERTEALDKLEQYLLHSGVSAEQATDSILLAGIGLRRDEPNQVLEQLLRSLKMRTIDQLMLMRHIQAVAADVRSIRYRGQTGREMQSRKR